MRYAIALPLALSLAAQDPRLEVESRLVLIPATVTNRGGRSVDGLEAPDFLVLDNGRPQRAIVDSFASGVAPIALVVAVQSSGISAPVLAKVRKIGAMIQPLVIGERGCAALVAFSDRVQWRQECTNDPDALDRAFEQLQPGEPRRGRMLDAVHEAVERLRRRPNVRRVLLLISESRDRGSETNLDTAVVAAQTAGITVYAAPYSAFKTAFTTKPSDVDRSPEPKQDPLPGTNPGPPSMQGPIPIPPPEQQVDILAGIGELVRLQKTKTTDVLIRRTGGAAFPFARQKGLEDAIQKLGAELHTQYVLSYAPEAPGAGYHRLEVRITRHGEFRVRARPGYWALERW